MGKFTPFLTNVERETIKFFNTPVNTIVPGLVSGFLYLLIFGVGLGDRISGSSDYLGFLVPGIIALNLINNTYANPSGSLYFSRWWGHIRDLLVSPIRYTTLLWSYICGGFARGYTMAFGTWIIAMPFVFVPVKNPLALIGFTLLTATVFACLGVLIGLWAKDWEQLNVFLNFLITPLIFLGGVFYSVNQVPSALATVTKLNPLFYMVNGIRYGFTGYSEASLLTGLVMLVVMAIILFSMCLHLFKKGWHLRS